MKTNYVPVLDDEFSEEDVHMAVKPLKQEELCSCTRRQVCWGKSSHCCETSKSRQIMFFY